MQLDLVNEMVSIAKGLKELKEKPERDEFLKVSSLRVWSVSQCRADCARQSRLGSLKLPARFQVSSTCARRWCCGASHRV